ncbi:Long-Chain-Fatty-Acid--Coa Ligase Acsbg1 [Manis pentadactyla]|nr:Long-Chain-Fatty-Acid--Coa Ligase Acsbg1 [Manis pentadactyla]
MHVTTETCLHGVFYEATVLEWANFSCHHSERKATQLESKMSKSMPIKLRRLRSILVRHESCYSTFEKGHRCTWMLNELREGRISPWELLQRALHGESMALGQVGSTLQLFSGPSLESRGLSKGTDLLVAQVVCGQRKCTVLSYMASPVVTSAEKQVRRWQTTLTRKPLQKFRTQDRKTQATAKTRGCDGLASFLINKELNN